jgi:hypothetical protein
MQPATIIELLRFLATLRISDCRIGQRHVGISIEMALVMPTYIQTKSPDANKSS